MTERQAQRIEFDKKVAELCADPLTKIDEMASRLNVHKATVQISFRRQGIIRKVGRPRKQQVS
jgi:predicted transcriptional regulator